MLLWPEHATIGRVLCQMPGRSTLPPPLIAIVGSADSERSDYEPPLSNLQFVRAAAEAIGAELARQGCRLIVYSSDSAVIEGDVVRGFIRSCEKEAEQLVQVRYPFGSKEAHFSEAAQNEKLFDYHTDPDLDWQASYYRSFRDADGVVIVGGGNTAFITGHLAISQRKALLPLACFGGAAQRIWQSLRPGQDLLTETDRNLMATPTWRLEYAKDLVAGLLAQHQRRLADLTEHEDTARRRNMSQNTRAILAMTLFAVAIGMAAWGGAFTKPTGSMTAEVGPAWLGRFLLYLIGPVAGAAGAMTRTIWRPTESEASIIATLGKGFAAGATAALLYLLAQQSTIRDADQVSSISLLFALAIGVLAGFTFDKVLARMADAEIRTDMPAARGASTDAQTRPRTTARNRSKPSHDGKTKV